MVISGNQARGWGLVMRRDITTPPYGQEVSLARWGTEGEVAFHKLDIGFSDGMQALAGTKLIVGSFGALGPTQFSEIDFDTGALSYSTQVGGDKSLNGAMVGLYNTGVAGVIFSNSPSGKVVFDAFYRAPVVPYPGVSEPTWITKHYEMPALLGFGQAYFPTAVQGPDGLVWVFFCRDSAGTIGLIRLRCVGNTLELVDFTDQLIGTGHGAMSPSGENLWPFCAVDKRNNRILLCYQNQPHLFTSCQGFRVASRHAITEVLSDKSVSLRAVNDWWTPHISYGYAIPALWPRPDGNYFAIEKLNVNGDCKLSWQLGMEKDGVFMVGSVLPEGRILSTSLDGWLFMYDRASNTSDLINLRFPPEITIRRSGSDVVINWDSASPSDVLESSADMQSWSPVPYAQRPVRLPANEAARFFRVKVYGL